MSTRTDQAQRDRFLMCVRMAEIPKATEAGLLPIAARCGIGLGILLTPNQRDWEWLSLPTSLSFLYHVVRPVRLLTAYLSKR